MTASPPPTPEVPRGLSRQVHRRLIGYLGLLLPLLIVLSAGVFPTAGLTRWKILDSVSGYWYTSAVGIFVGVLFALSLFLFTYRGYEGTSVDRVFGMLGGFAALGVALFPTAAPACSPEPCPHEPSWWALQTKHIHYFSAVSLFLIFIVFALWLFRKSSAGPRRDRPSDKRWRDDICLACGIVMILAVLWAAWAGWTNRPIFAPEAFAIVAFAISWLTKGEAHKPYVHAVRRLVGRPAA